MSLYWVVANGLGFPVRFWRTRNPTILPIEFMHHGERSQTMTPHPWREQVVIGRVSSGPVIEFRGWQMSTSAGPQSYGTLLKPLRLARLPLNHNRAGNKDRAVGTHQDAHNQRQGKIAQYFATEEKEGANHQKRCQGGVDRAR